MKQIKSWLLGCTSSLGFCLALAMPVLADQCAYTSKEQAMNAIASSRSQRRGIFSL